MSYNIGDATPSSGKGNLILGQVLSLCLTVGGTMSQILQRNYGVDLTALQMLTVYTSVAIISWFCLVHLAVEYFWTRDFSQKLPRIAIISFLDAMASFLCLHSYRYLTIPTVTLLSTLATPTVMMLSWLFLKSKFRMLNVGGAALSLFGVAFVSFYQLLFNGDASDTSTAASMSTDNFIGYIMCISSALSYGVSNVMMEGMMKSGCSLNEFIALNSTCSSIWSFLYLVFLRREEVGVFIGESFSMMNIYFTIYCISMIVFYVILPILANRASVTLCNLSLLTVNFFSVIVGALVFSESFSWQFWVGFAFVMTGLVMFNWPSSNNKTGLP